MKKLLVFLPLTLLLLLMGCRGRREDFTVMSREALSESISERVPKMNEEELRSFSGRIPDLMALGIQKEEYVPAADSELYSIFGGFLYSRDGCMIYTTQPDHPVWTDPDMVRKLGYQRFTLAQCDYTLEELYEAYEQIRMLSQSKVAEADCIIDVLPCYELNRVAIYVKKWNARISSALSGRIDHPERCVVVNGSPLFA